MLSIKMNSNDREKRKILRENVQLDNDKKKLSNEKLEAIQEKEEAKSYMNNLYRDFNWLKK